MQLEKLNVIVFGVGEIFHILRPMLQEMFNIISFADNDIEKQGALLDGIEVVDPKYIICSQNFDKVIVTVTGHQKYVVKQLVDYGVNKNDIILGVNYLMRGGGGYAV